MKKDIKWLFAALLMVCLLATLQAQKSSVNNPVNISVNNPVNIFVDTSGKSYTYFKPYNISNKSGKIEKNMVETAVDVAVEGWDAIFKKDRPKVVYDAFNIYVDTTLIENKPQPSVELSLANRNIPKVDEPVPVFEKKEITVKFENGKLVPINPKKDSVENVAKGILEDKFKIDIADNDNIDLDFFNNNSFVYKGEIYHRIAKEELESEAYKKPRIKTVVPVAKSVEPEVKTTIKHVKINSNEEFVDLYEDVALDGERYGVPYAITMAQGILESRGGRSRMAIALNNLFGIKCNGGRCQKPDCPHGYFDDDREDETFERYPSFDASFKRHVKFFINNDRYDKCLACGIKDINCWLYRLQKSGYATDRMYDYKLAEIINRYKLTAKPIHYERKKVAEQLKTNP